MPYELIYLEEFATWLDVQEKDLRLRTIANLGLLKERGPLLARPLERQRKSDEERARKEAKK